MSDHSSYNTNIHFLEQLSDRDFWNYAQSLATQQYPLPVNGEEALECQTEQGRCLFPLWALREVVALPYKLTRLPSCPSWMPGITAWRDSIIPVVDLTSYFFVQPTDGPATTQRLHPPASSRLLILDQANILLGLQVALVGSIITLEQGQLASSAEAPSWYPRHMLATLLGVYNGSVLLNLAVLVKQMIYQIHVGTH